MTAIRNVRRRPIELPPSEVATKRPPQKAAPVDRDYSERSSVSPSERALRTNVTRSADRPRGRGDIGAAPPRAAPPRSEAAYYAEVQRFARVKEMVEEHPRYLALEAEDRAVADEILDIARTKENPLYYGEKLKLLFDTPEAPEDEVAEAQHDRVDDAVVESKKRLETPEGKKNLDVEEKKSRDSSRAWTRLVGKEGSFDVDRTDPSDVIVKMKVHLSGAKDDVDATKSLEDDIEKAASTRGYTVDVQFTNRSAADVFEADVDPTGWTTSKNWVGSADSIAHEAHHRLGLDDRYDYIESHADNEQMKIPDRLQWFRVQIDKPFDPNGQHSLMGDGDKMLHDDVCGVAQLGDDCVEEREKDLGGI